MSLSPRSAQPVPASSALSSPRVQRAACTAPSIACTADALRAAPVTRKARKAVQRHAPRAAARTFTCTLRRGDGCTAPLREEFPPTPYTDQVPSYTISYITLFSSRLRL